jgi:broad specificity phosphatase PhoE
VSDRGWAGADPAPSTTVLLVRHGVTAHTADKRFSGGLGGSNPPLSPEGREQAERVADWLTGLSVDALVASPVRRARETADALAGRLALPVAEHAAFAEIDFGAWEGLTFAEAQRDDPDGVRAWLDSLDTPPGGAGESFRQVRERVLAGLGEVVAEHRGGTVALVSHVTPIKVLVAHALGAPLEAIYRMELSPASVSVLTAYEAPGGDPPTGSLRLFNARPDTLTLR